MLSFDAMPAGNGSVQAAVGDAIEDGGKPVLHQYKGQTAQTAGRYREVCTKKKIKQLSSGSECSDIGVLSDIPSLSSVSADSAPGPADHGIPLSRGVALTEGFLTVTTVPGIQPAVSQKRSSVLRQKTRTQQSLSWTLSFTQALSSLAKCQKKVYKHWDF